MKVRLDPQFVNRHADSQLKIDLLFFWNRHPNAKFTLGAIARSLDCGRRDDLEEAMQALVTAELLERHMQQGLPFYCLTTDSTKREPIVGLSSCGVGGWLRMSSQSRKQRIFRLMLEEAVSG
ncbi:hypothetical protein ACFLW2_00700 [Chloroflexota bacterium]